MKTEVFTILTDKVINLFIFTLFKEFIEMIELINAKILRKKWFKNKMIKNQCSPSF